MTPQEATPIVRSVSGSQEQILKDILTLYCPDGFDCDVTYSTGAFYKKIPAPRVKLDLLPQAPGVIQADVRALPLRSGSLSNIVFDPPFLAGWKTTGTKDGIMKKRFSSYRTVYDLWEMYQGGLAEFYRTLKVGGILVFKCQDTVDRHLNFFTHCKVMADAVAAGFYPKDLFILTAANRPIQSNLKKQVHARKFHSYFWVFEKKKGLVKY